MTVRTRISAGLAALLVLTFYAFVASGGSFAFPSLSDPGEANYADLAEGFRTGHLYMAHGPDARITALPNPWDYEARKDLHYVWDASYFNGRYYLYFSPLPALLFHLPHRFLLGAYPSDRLATLFFTAWAFVAAVIFAARALRLAHGRLLVPFPLWVLLIGLGNVAGFVLIEPLTYGVSIAAGMAVTATWAVSMLLLVESPTVGRSLNAGLWLALAIAARPNLGVLLFVAVPVMFRIARRAKLLVAFALPLAVIGSALIAYNVARFGDPFEFGVRYQLTHVNMADYRVCSVTTLAEAGRLCNHALHYVFAAPTIRSAFPFVDLPHAKLDPALTFPTPGHLTEQIGGLFPIAPVAIIGAVAALLLAAGLGARERDAGARSGLVVLAGGWLVLLGLASCWWVVARYSLDFMILIVTASVVCIESAMVHLRTMGLRMLPMRIAVVALSCYSIVLGVLLGFVGPGDAFRRLYPETFDRVARLFG